MQLMTWLKSSICLYEISNTIIAHHHLHWLTFLVRNTSLGAGWQPIQSISGNTSSATFHPCVIGSGISVGIWMVLFQVEYFAKHRSHVFSIVQMIVDKYIREDVSQWLQIQVPFPCSCRVENVRWSSTISMKLNQNFSKWLPFFWNSCLQSRNNW